MQHIFRHLLIGNSIAILLIRLIPLHMIPTLKIVIQPKGLPSKHAEEWNNGIFSLDEHEWCGLTCKPSFDINGEGTCCLKLFFASFFILDYISSNQPLVTCTPILLQLSPVSQVASNGEAFGLYYLMIGSDYSIYSRMPVFFPIMFLLLCATFLSISLGLFDPTIIVVIPAFIAWISNPLVSSFPRFWAVDSTSFKKTVSFCIVPRLQSWNYLLLHIDIMPLLVGIIFAAGTCIPLSNGILCVFRHNVILEKLKQTCASNEGTPNDFYLSTWIRS